MSRAYFDRTRGHYRKAICCKYRQSRNITEAGTM